VSKLLRTLLGRAIGFLNWFELGFLGFNAVQVGFESKGPIQKLRLAIAA
jgi:hypothetical protein